MQNNSEINDLHKKLNKFMLEEVSHLPDEEMISIIFTAYSLDLALLIAGCSDVLKECLISCLKYQVLKNSREFEKLNISRKEFKEKNNETTHGHKDPT